MKSHKDKWDKLKDYIGRKLLQDHGTLAWMNRVPEYEETAKMIEKHHSDFERILKEMEKLEGVEE